MTQRDERNGDSVFPGFGTSAEGPAELVSRLAALRQSRGLSQTEVAARMGTSQSAVARLEAGKADVRMSTLARYAEAMDTAIHYDVRTRAERP